MLLDSEQPALSHLESQTKSTREAIFGIPALGSRGRGSDGFDFDLLGYKGLRDTAE